MVVDAPGRWHGFGVTTPMGGTLAWATAVCVLFELLQHGCEEWRHAIS